MAPITYREEKGGETVLRKSRIGLAVKEEASRAQKWEVCIDVLIAQH